MCFCYCYEIAWQREEIDTALRGTETNTPVYSVTVKAPRNHLQKPRSGLKLYSQLCMVLDMYLQLRGKRAGQSELGDFTDVSE